MNHLRCINIPICHCQCRCKKQQHRVMYWITEISNIYGKHQMWNIIIMLIFCGWWCCCIFAILPINSTIILPILMIGLHWEKKKKYENENILHIIYSECVHKYGNFALHVIKCLNNFPGMCERCCTSYSFNGIRIHA